MDIQHKNNIDQHMDRCVRETNFDCLFQELVKNEMFNAFMQEEILAVHADDRTRFMFEYIKTRGPDAYKKLIYSLHNTGHEELALLFDYRLLKPTDDEENLEVVRKAIERKDLKEPSKVYLMGSKPRGLALIININKYVNNVKDDRDGAQIDVARLQSVFTQLSYDIILKEDLSSQEIKDEVSDFARLEAHSQCDSCVVIIMTHGSPGKVPSTVNLKGYDGEDINSEDLIKEFYGYNCKNLVGKPKMFFFQTCRGKTMDHAITPPTRRRNVQVDGYAIHRNTYSREADDIYVVFPSAPGKVSMRHPEEGSWFIQELCNVICESAWNTHLEDMIKKVDRNIKERYDSRYGKQTTCYYGIGFSKELYFNPGLFGKS